MSKKRPQRPERTEKRVGERAAVDLVRAKEKLAAMSPGGVAERPIEVTSSAVVEIRVNAMKCPQCDGDFRIVDHRSAGKGMRPVDVKCNVCGAPRTLWFRIVEDVPN